MDFREFQKNNAPKNIFVNLHQRVTNMYSEFLKAFPTAICRAIITLCSQILGAFNSWKSLTMTLRVWNKGLPCPYASAILDFIFLVSYYPDHVILSERRAKNFHAEPHKRSQAMLHRDSSASGLRMTCLLGSNFGDRE